MSYNRPIDNEVTVFPLNRGTESNFSAATFTGVHHSSPDAVEECFTFVKMIKRAIVLKIQTVLLQYSHPQQESQTLVTSSFHSFLSSSENALSCESDI